MPRPTSTLTFWGAQIHYSTAVIGGPFVEDKCLSYTTADVLIPTVDRKFDESRTSGGQGMLLVSQEQCA